MAKTILFVIVIFHIIRHQYLLYKSYLLKSLLYTVSKGDQYNLSALYVVVQLFSGARLVWCCVPCQLAHTGRRRRTVHARLNGVYCYKGAAKNILPYRLTVGKPHTLKKERLYMHIYRLSLQPFPLENVGFPCDSYSPFPLILQKKLCTCVNPCKHLQCKSVSGFS